jgi:hypothetical protein
MVPPIGRAKRLTAAAKRELRVEVEVAVASTDATERPVATASRPMCPATSIAPARHHLANADHYRSPGASGDC